MKQEYKKLADFVKNPTAIADGLIGKKLNYNNVEFDEVESIEKDIADYVKKQSKKSKNFGKNVVNEDKALNERLKGKSEAELKNMSGEINDRMKDLQMQFRAGSITEHYYTKRMEQLKNRDFKSPLPPMFEIDKMPSQKEYMKQNDLEDLPKDDQKLVYQHAKDKAQKDRDDFFRRQYLRENELANNPVYSLEETSPELKGTDKIYSPIVEEIYGAEKEIKDILHKDMMRTSNDYESEIDGNEKSEDSFEIITNEVNEVEQVHIDIGEEELAKTDMIPDKGKEKNLERDSIKSDK